MKKDQTQKDELEIKKAPEELTEQELKEINGGAYYRYVMEEAKNCRSK